MFVSFDHRLPNRTDPTCQIARAHLEAFDKLLDAYSQIGDAIPGLLAYKTAFERHPTLAAVLEDYYSDILRFHQEALEVFNRSSTSPNATNLDI